MRPLSTKTPARSAARPGLLLVAVLAVVLVGSVPLPSAQTVPAGNVVVGAGNFSPIVADLDRSLEFYRDLLGLEVAGASGPRAFNGNTPLLDVHGVSGAQIRFATARIPGSTMGVEMVDFKDVDRKAVQPRPQDPGAVRLILLVRDIDGLLDRLKNARVPVVTASGTPVTLRTGPTVRAVMLRDPDGFFVELLQIDPLPETTAPLASNIVGARLSLTVASTDETMRFYREVLGFQPQGAASFSNDRNMRDLMGIESAQIRRSAAQIPGSTVQMEFLEFKGVARAPLRSRLQDPGSTRLQLRVRDIDAAMKIIKAAGAHVVTTGGEPVTMGNLHLAVVRDPNNLFLVLMQAQTQTAPKP